MLTESGNLTDLADTGYSESDIQNFFAGLGRQFDVSVESSDVGALKAKLMGEGGCIRQIGGNPQRCFDQFTEQYRRRGGADTTPGVEGSGGQDSSSMSEGSLRVETPIARPVVAGRAYETVTANGTITGYRAYTPPPPPVASLVVGDMALTSGAPPTVGPVGLADPMAPINYANGAVGPEFGYGFGGTPEGTTLSSTTGTAGSRMGMVLLLVAAGVAAFFLLKKK